MAIIVNHSRWLPDVFVTPDVVVVPISYPPSAAAETVWASRRSTVECAEPDRVYIYGAGP